MFGGIISQFDDFSIKFVGQNGFGNTTDFMPDEIAIRQLTKKSWLKSRLWYILPPTILAICDLHQKVQVADYFLVVIFTAGETFFIIFIV